MSIPSRLRRRRSHAIAGSKEAVRAALRERTNRIDAYFEQARVARTAILGGDGSVIMGPWLGEVGYELLGWIPFLRKCFQEVPGLAERSVVVSRGGTSRWYADLGVPYVETFDLVSAHDLFKPSHKARAASDGPLRRRGKPRSLTTAERLVADRVARHLNLGHYTQLHPSHYFVPMLMAKAVGDWRRIDDLLEFGPIMRPLTAPAGDGAVQRLVAALPERFVAARIYANDAFDGAACSAAQTILDAVTSEIPVVDISTGLRLDDHRPFELHGAISLPVLCGPDEVTIANNLCLQTEALARASAFVGAFGGFSFLPPMLGVPAVALHTSSSHVRHYSFHTASRLFTGGDYAEWHAMRVHDSGSSAGAAARLVCDLACANTQDAGEAAWRG